MADSVIYTEVKFNKSAAKDTGTGVGIVHVDRTVQPQRNSKLLWVLCGAIFILLTAVIGMAIEMVRLHGKLSRCGVQSQRSLHLRPNRSHTELPPTVPNIYLPRCPDGWVAHKELCYFIGHTRENRSSALNICRSFSSQLANTEDSDTLRFLRQRMQSGSYWIGLSRPGNGTDWFWTDDRQLHVTSFFNNTDHSGRFCATVARKTIYAEHCDAIRGYICEKKACAM